MHQDGNFLERGKVFDSRPKFAGSSFRARENARGHVGGHPWLKRRATVVGVEGQTQLSPSSQDISISLAVRL